VASLAAAALGVSGVVGRRSGAITARGLAGALVRFRLVVLATDILVMLLRVATKALVP
jgi:hypothetical protein